MTIFTFLHPWDFYQTVRRHDKNFMSFDLGEFSTGICIYKALTDELYPIMGKGRWQGYVLSPLESMLNELSDGSGGHYEGLYVPNKLFSPQVLNGTTMAVSEMRNSLNELAIEHKVDYYVFGFNADQRRWNDRDRYNFIKKQLKDLEEDGGLTKKFFTFTNEFGTTKLATEFFEETLPELFDRKIFLEKHPVVKDRMKTCRRYQDSKGEIDLDGENFKHDLEKLCKRVIDSNAACKFTWAFLNLGAEGFFGRLLGGSIIQKMIEYAAYLNYPESASPMPIPPRPIPQARPRPIPQAGGRGRGGGRGGGGGRGRGR